MKDLLPWYRSTDEIHAEISDLASSCQAQDATAEMFVSGGLDVFRLKPTSSGTKAVLVFGEHARELISPESALGLVRSLCGKGEQSELARQTLAKGVEFVIVPNANPQGRKQVEQGYYCKRTNENGVDINRNWGDEHRNGRTEGDEAYPGSEGFSEPETKALRDLVDTEKPDVFLSVHSGSYLLGSSPGYGASPPENADTNNRVLKPISDKYCHGNCAYGGLYDVIGYNAGGCDIDYIHEQSGVPYAFTWEIYNGFGGGEFLQQQSQSTRRSADRMFRGTAQASLSVEAPKPEDAQNPQDCITRFNPRSEKKTKEVVGIWTGAFLDLASIIVERKQLDACKAAKANGSPGAWDCFSHDVEVSPVVTAAPLDSIQPDAELTSVPTTSAAPASTTVPTISSDSQDARLESALDSDEQVPAVSITVSAPTMVTVNPSAVAPGMQPSEGSDAQGISEVDQMSSLFAQPSF